MAQQQQEAPPSVVERCRQQMGEKKFQEVVEAFNMFDEDGNGKIEVNELCHVLRNCGQNPSLKEIQQMIDQAESHKPEKDRDGKLDFDEFLLMTGEQEFNDRQTEEVKLLRAFKKFDKDGSGTIDRNELSHALKTLGEKMSQQEVDEMMEEADVNKDGVVDYEEFVRLLLD